MRGSPPLHLFICLLGFALLALPLARLTFARPDIVAMKDANQSAPVTSTSTPTLIRIRFAHAPETLSLKLGVKELAPSPISHLPSPLEIRAAVPIPADGIELILNATWPQGTPDTAITVELEPDDKDARTQTCWSRGAQMSEVLSFSW